MYQTNDISTTKKYSPKVVVVVIFRCQKWDCGCPNPQKDALCSYGAHRWFAMGSQFWVYRAPSFIKNQIPDSFKVCDYFFAVQEKQRCIFVLRKVFERRSNVNTDFSQGQDNKKAKTASKI